MPTSTFPALRVVLALVAACLLVKAVLAPPPLDSIALSASSAAAVGWALGRHMRSRRQTVPHAARPPAAAVADLGEAFDQLPASVVFIDPVEMRVLRVNAHALREFNLDRTQLLGGTLVAALGDQARVHLVPGVRRAACRGGT